MKKKILIASILSSMILFSNCGKQQEDIKISKWMFSDDLNPYMCENVLGSSDGKNHFKQYVWNDFELIDGYKGTLTLSDSKDQDFLSTNEDRKMYCFHWTIQCDESDYSDIINKLKSYEYVQETIQNTDDNNDGEQISFVTDFEDKNYNPNYLKSGEKGYFSIVSNYKDDVFELQWRISRRAIKSNN